MAPSKKGSRCASCNNFVGRHRAVVCQMGQNRPTFLVAMYFKSTFDELLVKLQLSMKESLSEVVIALKSELRFNTEMMKVRVESWFERVQSRLVAMNTEINALDIMVNRSNFIISGLPEDLNDISLTVIKIAEYYSVTVRLHDISFADYMKNNKTILVKLNSIEMRSVFMGKYFKNIKVGPRHAANCIFQQRSYINDHLCPAAVELNKTSTNLRKKSKIMRFKIVNTLKPYSVLVPFDGNIVKVDLQACGRTISLYVAVGSPSSSLAVYVNQLTNPNVGPIVCGVFESGSTLTKQMRIAYINYQTIKPSSRSVKFDELKALIMDKFAISET
uniref:Uncharacterized protein n=1 Tax=Glossina palpalis gambiensis TaxID=67801 RepID=A0A1B0BVD1_9MUSC